MGARIWGLKEEASRSEIREEWTGTQSEAGRGQEEPTWSKDQERLSVQGLPL